MIPRLVRNCEFELLIGSRDSAIEKGASIEEIQVPFSIVLRAVVNTISA